MDMQKFETTLAVGETVAVEFKRCGGKIETDTYETVCSFLNRFGGDIYLGVNDNGAVIGIPEKAASDLIKNFISVVSNPNTFAPTVYLAPEILDYKGKKIIHIHVPPSSEVHTFKKVIYDRVKRYTLMSGMSICALTSYPVSVGLLRTDTPITPGKS